MSVALALSEVRERMAAAARTAGRDPENVTLVAVTKQTGLVAIEEALAAAVVDLGENRAQDMVPKAEALAGHTPAPRWHFIGRLQRNKVKALASHVALWQSVDRRDLATEIGRRAPGAVVLVQVNVAGEQQKGGCAPEETAALVDGCRDDGCDVRGLMTVPAAATDPRPVFEKLRSMTDDLGLSVCSMGMSGDYETAIACGSTMVRIGSAIFGPYRATAGSPR